jgi:glucosamine--fructose-6-phosphate aminotransferase (isomerizing)
VSTLPRWAQRLKDQHPDGAMPTRAQPIPDWIAAATAKTPLWYIIREAQEVRTEHPFVLYREIGRQPDQWADILANYWPEVSAVAEAVESRGIERIITTGCGSALFTAMHGEFVMSRIGGLPTTAIESFELTNWFPNVDAATTLVIAHSGTGGSIETVEAVRAARERGCLTLALTNTADTAVGRAAELALTYQTRQECGPCISVVSTRILLATMLGFAIAERTGYDTPGAQPLRASLDLVADTGRAIIAEQESQIRELATALRDANSWLLVGSGPHYFSAREGTLKIEEQANLIGKALRAGDFHHDSLSVLAPDRVVEAPGAAASRVVDVVRAAHEGGSPTVAVTWTGTRGAAELAAVADTHIPLRNSLPELISPIPLTMLFQLIGYHLAVARGRNPDTLMTDHEPNTRAWLTSFPLGTH